MKRTLKADSFFTPEERDCILQATHAVEKRTIGEIAVMVVDSSSRYRETEVVGGIILGSTLSFVITTLFFSASLWSYIPLSFFFYFPSWYLFRKSPLLKTAFITSGRKEETVRERAVRAFYEKGLYRTQKNTGVLFFVSVLERKVWVLADRGIHEKIGQDTLNTFARTVSRGIREGRAGNALCDAIHDAGVLLEKHFPKTPEDTDELSDEIMTGA